MRKLQDMLEDEGGCFFTFDIPTCLNFMVALLMLPLAILPSCLLPCLVPLLSKLGPLTAGM